MKTKHTQGEWIPQIGTLTTSIRDERNISICEIKNLSLPNEFEANANLIAAAPTMLKELETVKRELNCIYNMLVSGETPSDEYVNNLIHNIAVELQKATPQG